MSHSFFSTSQSMTILPSTSVKVSLTSTSTSLPTSSAASTPQSSGKSLAIGIALGIVGVLVVGAAMFFVWRLLHRRTPSPSRRESHERLASRITPFGTPGVETPRFVHTPGSDMRIATRRADGVWEFGDPRAPFTPGGVSEIDHTPSPSSSSVFSYPRSATPSSMGGYGKDGDYHKWSDYKGSRKAALAYEDYEPSSDVLPPPAYVYGHPHPPEGYLNQSAQWR